MVPEKGSTMFADPNSRVSDCEAGMLKDASQSSKRTQSDATAGISL